MTALICVGILLSLAAYVGMRKLENKRDETELARLGNRQIANIREALAVKLAFINSVRGFFNGSEEVTRDEFRHFTENYVKGGGIFKAVVWAPRVDVERIAQWEAMARHEGVADYKITQRITDDDQTRKSTEIDCFPIYYIEPQEANRAIMGTDLASDPAIRELLIACRDSDQPTIGQKIKLQGPPGRIDGILIAVPVLWKEQPADSLDDRRGNLRGYVVGSVALVEFFHRTLVFRKPIGVDVTIEDLSAPLADQQLWFNVSRARDNFATALADRDAAFSDGMVYSETLELGGRTWRVLCTPTPQFYQMHGFRIAWMVLAGGLLLTALFAGLLMLYFGRAAAVRKALEAVQSKDKSLAVLRREIAKRRQKEAELRKLSVAIEHNPAAIVITDIQGNIEYVNPKFTEITGYAFEEALGKNPQILKSGHTPDEEYADLWHTILSGNHWRGEFHNRKKNGELYWEMAVIAPIKDESGEIVNFMAVKEDITARKYAEEALTKSEERARLLLDSTAEGIYGIDLDGNCTFCNPACVKMLGHRHAADLLGMDMHRKIHHSHANGAPYAQDECRIYRAIRRGQGVHVEDEVFWRADGSSFPVEYWAYPQRSEGKIVGSVVAFIDITQRRRNEAALQKAGRDLARTNRELQRASEVKSRFLANMSHEIRTPLNAVIGMSGLLADTPLNEQQQDYCETIRASGEVLLTVINDILDFSKIEADKMDLDSQPFELVKCVNDAMGIVTLRAQEKNLELSFQPAEGLPKIILGDAVRLRQILVNLLNNAVKFTDQGQVSMSLSGSRRDDGRYDLHFAVADTGPGIPPDQRDRLFQSFSQLDVSAHRRHGGTGLGLSISKRLCELMGGRIWVESSGVPGKGSTFHFTIIAAEAPAEPPPATPSDSGNIPDASAPPRTLRILLAEDNPVNQKVARAMLDKLGHVADVASDGREALEAVERNVYDVVLMDCQMPHMDGYDATRKIRELEKRLGRRPTRIIALTASALLGDRQRCLDAGMDAYLSKPVRPAELRQALQDIAADPTGAVANLEVPVSIT